ncbi:MAG: methyltransferase domain-containing protein [Candidatus Omnitrophota bacterium]
MQIDKNAASKHVLAALANIAVFDSVERKKIIDGSPHIKHLSLRLLYSKLIKQVYDCAQKRTLKSPPKILDLGAGDGLTTLAFLELGAVVTAVDISDKQLVVLKNKCRHFNDRLEVRCGDIEKIMKSENSTYDVIVVSSFLHHIPDYLGLIRKAVILLSPRGQFFSFQDPLKYDTIGKPSRIFSILAYFSWRIFKGDLWGGLKRHIRRSRGLYLDNSVHDNAEYHVTRKGVDQNAIVSLLNNAGFKCDLIRYFSIQGKLLQSMGSALNIKNTFAIIAQKRDKD